MFRKFFLFFFIQFSSYDNRGDPRVYNLGLQQSPAIKTILKKQFHYKTNYHIFMDSTRTPVPGSWILQFWYTLPCLSFLYTQSDHVPRVDRTNTFSPCNYQYGFPLQYLQEPLPRGIIKLTILVDQIYHVSSWSPLWIRLAQIYQLYTLYSKMKSPLSRCL